MNEAETNGTGKCLCPILYRCWGCGSVWEHQYFYESLGRCCAEWDEEDGDFTAGPQVVEVPCAMLAAIPPSSRKPFLDWVATFRPRTSRMPSRCLTANWRVMPAVERAPH
jgi:hypothetical protein